ncbi:MAG: outer membrane beta-barrel protein [Holophagales bacterium]|jgi:opacity protein-like surface antigen|nr:outer membrane beta-barrel protein [Holophagales bacterium]
MRLAPRFALLALAAALAAASPASAQDRRGTVEITPVIGGTFGGTFDSGTLAFYDGEAKTSTEVAYGIRLGFNVAEHFTLEASYLQSDPKLTIGDGGSIGGQSEDIGRMEMRFYELNMLVPWGRGQVRPYFLLGGGVHTFHPDLPGYSSSTDSRFTGTLGFGVKAFVTPNIGFRFEGKARTTYINSGDDYWECDGWCDDGYYYGSNQWYTSGEATAGVVFAF